MTKNYILFLRHVYVIKRKIGCNKLTSISRKWQSWFMKSLTSIIINASNNKSDTREGCKGSNKCSLILTEFLWNSSDLKDFFITLLFAFGNRAPRTKRPNKGPWATLPILMANSNKPPNFSTINTINVLTTPVVITINFKISLALALRFLLCNHFLTKSS